MLGNNFGLFGSQSKAKSLLKEFNKVTNEKARIITESNDPYGTTNPFHLEYHELNRKKKKNARSTENKGKIQKIFNALV